MPGYDNTGLSITAVLVVSIVILAAIAAGTSFCIFQVVYADASKRSMSVTLASTNAYIARNTVYVQDAGKVAIGSSSGFRTGCRRLRMEAVIIGTVIIAW